jgi:predicted GNAT family acetyltransferase
MISFSPARGLAAATAIPMLGPSQTRKTDDMTDVTNNKADHRYELTVDGHLAATYYKISDDVITFVHTEVSPELGGKGIGSKLVKGALDQVRSQGLKVVAECPFVKGYIDKHPEYSALLKA